MKLKRPVIGALISLGVVLTLFISVSVSVSSHNGNYVEQSANVKEDSQSSFEALYADQSDSPTNNPSLYVNSTKDIQPPLTEIVEVVDDNNKPANTENGTTIMDGDYIMVKFNATDKSEIKNYECSFDSKTWIECISPVVVYRDDNNNRTKTIEIRAIDIHNNIEEQKAVLLYETR